MKETRATKRSSGEGISSENLTYYVDEVVMMQGFFCKAHPMAGLVNAGSTRNGAYLFICCRCSNSIYVKKGVVDSIDMRKSTGQVVTRSPRDSRRHLFFLDDVRGFRPRLGQMVLFESGISSTEKDDYVPTAMNLQQIEFQRTRTGKKDTDYSYPDILSRAYGLSPSDIQQPGPEKLQRRMTPGRRVRFELFSSREDSPLVSYVLAGKTWRRQPGLIVPIRHGLSGQPLKAEITVGGGTKKGGIFLYLFRRRHYRQAYPPQDCTAAEENGLTIHINRKVRAKGVISEVHSGGNSGLIKCGATLFFRREWMIEGQPKVGCEVTYIPVIEVGQGLQGRAIRPLE